MLNFQNLPSRMDYLSVINCIRANFNMSHLMPIHSINDDQLHAERFSAKMSASFTVLFVNIKKEKNPLDNFDFILFVLFAMCGVS